MLVSRVMPRALPRRVGQLAGQSMTMALGGEAVDLSTITYSTSLMVGDMDVIQTTRDVFSSVASKLVVVLVSNLLLGVLVGFFSGVWNTGKEMGQGLGQNLTQKQAQATSQWVERLTPVDIGTLFVCVAVDLLGDASFLIPGVGEVEDLVWAPIAALVMQQLFGSKVLTAASAAKEVLPFTDALPLASLAWACKNVYPDSSLAKLLGVTTRASPADAGAGSGDGTIDVPADGTIDVPATRDKP